MWYLSAVILASQHNYQKSLRYLLELIRKNYQQGHHEIDNNINKKYEYNVLMLIAICYNKLG